MNVYFLSLGCLKNQADSERLIRALGQRGAVFVPSPEEARVLIVNTCGFIDDAKRESIEEILALSSLKQDGGEHRLVVIGCLSGRYRDDLAQEMPEIDALFGVGEDEAVLRWFDALCAEESGHSALSAVEAPLLSAGPYAPLKIAEGCNRGCTFCVIPSIRGRFNSRDEEEIIAEAGMFLDRGVRELLVVAQDLTAYGRDTGRTLPGLLSRLARLRDQEEYRVRPLYLHPASLDDALLDVIARETRITSYIDLPLQHSEAGILRAMGRPGGRDEYLRLIEHIRTRLPGAVIRTSLIVGFPGERDEDFLGLMDFVQTARFDRLGVFVYSQEEGTPAAAMSAQVDEEEKQQRQAELMSLQAEISREYQEALIGTEARVLIDALNEDGAVGRTQGQAPDVDGVTVISAGQGDVLQPGMFVDVVITDADDYDLYGEVAQAGA